MSLIKSTCLLAWMAGIIMGLGAVQEEPNWPLLVGGFLMMVVVIFGFVPMAEGRPKKTNKSISEQ